MRYAWISALVILLDQLSKWLIPYLGLGGWHSPEFSRLYFEFAAHISFNTADFRTLLTNSTSLVLIAALLSIHLLITRLSGQLHFIADKSAIGLQLAGGGLASLALDIAFRGDVINAVLVRYADDTVFESSIADIALVAGFILLLTALLRGSTKLQSRIPLSAASLVPLQFNLLPRGIDNIHIDVHLSPRFREAITRTVHNLVPLTIKHLQQGKWQFSLPAKQASLLRNEFNELMSVALNKAKASGEKQLPDLLFISILKFIHGEVNNTVAATLKQSKEGSREHSLRGLKAKSNSDVVEWLFRYNDNIIALTNRILLEALFHKQGPNIQKTVKNFLGVRTLFAIQAMETPLILSESPSNELVQIEHYLILGQQQSDKNSFVNIDRELTTIFSDYLNLMEAEIETQGQPGSHLQDTGNINSNTIDTLSQPSVMMNPRNITILLDTERTEKRIREIQKLSNWKKYRNLRHHLHFQRRLKEKVKADLFKSELASWIIAAYAAKDILEKTTSDIQASHLTAILSRKQSRQEFSQKLPEILKGLKRPPAKELVLQHWERSRKDPDRLLDKYLLRFLHDFSHYRRDLLRLFIYQRAASEINLLHNRKDIETSRANFTLYEFVPHSEAQTANAPILSHIIIKADLRGSTEVTEKLTELELNPATHFDRNFFSPINNVIESYGAEKVFIEGDAIILILNEHAGENTDRLIAARACGLAAKFLQIITKQNRELVAYGLPQLELGIGIAYHQGPPRYLFDEQHRITISPAINRADRLSACTWSIRNWRSAQSAPDHFVEVYQPSENAVGHGEKAQKAMVFNLNGILLEESAYQRLGKELTLKKVNNPLGQINDSSLFAIHFPDLVGNGHSLVVRKAPVHIYDPEYSVDSCPRVEERYFYEVIWRDVLLDQLRKK